MLTQEQQAIADAAVFVIITAPVDQQIDVLKTILGKYIDCLMADQVRTNVDNYHQAIKNRIAELAIGECVGSA